ncbi:hypothetical protein GCM10027074_74010 [Streptomyces deserti]
MVILTALSVEHEAVLAHLTEVVQREHDSGTVFDCGRLADTGWTAALALIGEGNETAAVITHQAYSLFGRTPLLFVGVAGGLKDDIQIGDVVVGTHIYAYHGAKVDPGASYGRPRVWPASHRLLQRAYRVRGGPDFTVHHKPIAAGDVVLNDHQSDLRRQINDRYNDTAAIEMESAGVAAAAHVIGGLDVLTIRGISDKADGRKYDADAHGWQREAASRAATVAVALLRGLGKGTLAGPASDTAPLPLGPVAEGESAPGTAAAPPLPEPLAVPGAGPGTGLGAISPAGSRAHEAPGSAGRPGAVPPPSAPAHSEPTTTPEPTRSEPAPTPSPTRSEPTPTPTPARSEPGSTPTPGASTPGQSATARPSSPATGEPATTRAPAEPTPVAPVPASAPSPGLSESGTTPASPAPAPEPAPQPSPTHLTAVNGSAPPPSGPWPALLARRLRRFAPAVRFRLPRSPRALAGLALAGILAGVLVWLLPDRGDTPVEGPSTKLAATLPSCPADQADTTLRIAASVDLSRSLSEAAAGYGPRRSAGHCVNIVVDGVNSGTAMRALAGGWTEVDGRRPDVWSPAGSEWLALARAKAEPQALALLPETATPIVTSPLTIAMPKTMAEALGWPEQRVGWKDLAQWAENPRHFWAERGQKQWGPLKLGKTNPHYSTSGLNATIGAFYAKTGTTGELSEKDVDAPANQALVKNIEKSVVHYGDTTLTFLANLRAADDAGGADEALDYISAVTVEESAVVAYNLGYPCGAYSSEPGCAKTGRPATPLVSLYPKDSNPVSDHPYVQLKGLSPAKEAVSEDFLRHLHSKPVFEKFFAPYGYRTHEGQPGSGITRDNGALPKTEISSYNPPKGAVLDRIQQVWSAVRRPANVLVVIDTSTSMEEEVPGTNKSKMQLLKEAEPALFGEFGDRDRVGLWKFSNAANLDGKRHYQPLVPIGPMGEKLPEFDGLTRRGQLTKEVKGLVPNGATGLYGTVDAAVGTMRDSYDPEAINAIVLLTDGRNEGVPDTPTLDDVLSRIGDPDQRIRVFTIAYGSDADEQDADGRTVLQNIAAASGARAYDAKDPEVIRAVLTSVISNF